MTEYIEREALEVALNHRLNFLMAENGEYDHYTSGFDEAVTRVENFPAADVVEVVRCRECKYWGDEAGELQRSDGVLFARCKVHNYLLDGRHTGWCPTENDFCSYGERKGGAD